MECEVMGDGSIFDEFYTSDVLVSPVCLECKNYYFFKINVGFFCYIFVLYDPTSYLNGLFPVYSCIV